MEVSHELTDRPPRILAVVNCTPDSFSGGGPSTTEALEGLLETINQSNNSLPIGVDIGGESTAPGSKPISAIEEIDRIRETVGYFATTAFVSVDTYKASTANWALEHGARMINDVSALRGEPEIASVAAEHSAFVALMYSKAGDGPPHADREPKEYSDVIQTISEFWSERIDFALKSGIAQERIILDPGMGAFVSPNPKYSWEILARLPELRERFPEFQILVGTSRKGFLGGELRDRDPLSQLTGLRALLSGADIIRTHNPAMAQEFARCWDSMSQN